MENITFDDVVQAWQQSPSTGHPLWEADRNLYWASGEAQAGEAAQYIPAGGKVLDFGAGDGRVAIPLSKLGFSVLAVDSSPQMLRKLEAYAQRKQVLVSTSLSDGTDLGQVVGRRKVDAVVCRSVLIHHDHDGATRLVTALASVLKKGGHLIADWPTGSEQEQKVRGSWIDVTVWSPEHRARVAHDAGLDPVATLEEPSVWIKR